MNNFNLRMYSKHYPIVLYVFTAKLSARSEVAAQSAADDLELTINNTRIRISDISTELYMGPDG